MGTPKTLKEAILNGINDASDNDQLIDDMIEKHVKDYLAQKFQRPLFSKNANERQVAERVWKLVLNKE